MDDEDLQQSLERAKRFIKTDYTDRGMVKQNELLFRLLIRMCTNHVLSEKDNKFMRIGLKNRYVTDYLDKFVVSHLTQPAVTAPDSLKLLLFVYGQR
ncbi:hypothetical protein K1W63_02730 [Weissella cibaria]|nr:hypothetical protein [Weissella cibaria]